VTEQKLKTLTGWWKRKW